MLLHVDWRSLLRNKTFFETPDVIVSFKYSVIMWDQLSRKLSFQHLQTNTFPVECCALVWSLQTSSPLMTWIRTDMMLVHCWIYATSRQSGTWALTDLSLFVVWVTEQLLGAELWQGVLQVQPWPLEFRYERRLLSLCTSKHLRML